MSRPAGDRRLRRALRRVPALLHAHPRGLRILTAIGALAGLAWGAGLEDPRAENPPAAAGEAIEILDGASTPIGARIDALRVLAARRDPASAPALFRVFARARFGELPEDPDLFERALEIVETLPPEAVGTGIRDGLAPELARLAIRRLDERYATRIAPGSPGPGLPPADRAALDAAVAAELAAAWDAHGMALVEAMETEGGSVVEDLAARVEERVLDSWEADPARAGLADEVREARRLAGSRPPGPFALPAVPPGLTPGREPIPPREPASAAVRRGAGPVRPRRSVPWIAVGTGLLAATALLARRRPRVGAFALGLALLALAEGALRMSGTAPLPPPFAFAPAPGRAFEPVTLAGEPWLATRGGSVRFRRIRAVEEPGAFRVFVLGASSAHGSHYVAEDTFAGLLEESLRARHPGVEVVNLAVGGAISDGLRARGEEALSLGADLLLVYDGHNEVGQFVRAGRMGAVRPSWPRFALRRLALYSALGSAFGGGEGSPTARETELSRGEVAALHRLAVANFRANLGALLDAAAARDVPVILAGVATNYRFAHLEPFSGDGPGSRADLDARLARAEALSAEGRHAEARAAWQAAIDRSASPREATTGILEATEDLAREYDCTFVDVPRLFASRSPDGLAVSGLFWDDVHLRREGHAVLAEALLPVVEEFAEARR